MQDSLQQHLPFTVLKLAREYAYEASILLRELQQHLPFTVLKLNHYIIIISCNIYVATAPTVYGIETLQQLVHLELLFLSCNSTYRLRY